MRTKFNLYSGSAQRYPTRGRCRINANICIRSRRSPIFLSNQFLPSKLLFFAAMSWLKFNSLSTFYLPNRPKLHAIECENKSFSVPPLFTSYARIRECVSFCIPFSCGFIQSLFYHFIWPRVRSIFASAFACVRAYAACMFIWYILVAVFVFGGKLGILSALQIDIPYIFLGTAIPFSFALPLSFSPRLLGLSCSSSCSLNLLYSSVCSCACLRI